MHCINPPGKFLKMMKNIVYILIVFALTACREQPDPGLQAQAEARIDSLENLLKRTVTERDSLNAVTEQLKWELKRDNYWFDNDSEGRTLSAKGIKDPAAFIEESLKSQPELIPDQAILGGTMQFWKIEPLGGRWVIADYSDGHIAGRAIYTYRLGAGNRLEFKLLANSEE